MRYLITAISVFAFYGTGYAQQLQLMTTDNLPAASVQVILSYGKKQGEIALLSDAAGKVKLPLGGYPYSISVHDMSYEDLRDTIGEAYNKVLWLQPKTISEVVVTGQYGSVAADKAVQRIEVIDRKKIDAMAAQNLRDVLTNQLEIRLDYDPIFGTSMNMQGSKNYGADAKILIDGVPVVGKQNGAVDLSQINLANVERVEIVKGPMSVSYGTDAIAGTVNLITKKTVKNSKELYTGTYYETPGTYNVYAGGGLRIRSHSIRLDGFRNFFGGWKPGNGISFFDFSPRPADTSRVLLWKPREQYQGALQYLYTRKKTTFNYKGTYFYEVITNRGMPLAPYQEMAFDNRFHTWRKDNALFVNSDLGKGKHLNVFAAYNAYKRIKTEVANDLTTLNETIDRALQDTSKYSEVNSRGVLTGSSGRKIDYEIGYDVNMQFANSTQIADRKQDMVNYAAYASAEYRPFEGFTVRPGLRYGYNTRYAAPLVPSINLMYQPATGLALRASYARGFRQPGLKELYFDFVDINHNIHGNPELRAEYSNNYQASLSYSWTSGKAKYKASVSSSYNKVHNLITLVLKTGGTANEYWYMNISDFTTKNLVSSVDIAVGSFNVMAGASCVGTYNQLSEREDVPAFSYSPEVVSSIRYALKQHGLSMAVFYKFTGSFVQYISGSNGEAMQSRMGDYSVADVTLQKTFFNKRLSVMLGCKNIFNVTSIQSYQAGGAHSGGSGLTAIGMGRIYFLKTDINLSK
jgi:outer membrane receptor for ferrienterochelin and colicins